MSVKRFFEDFFRAREAFSSVASATGRQLESAELEMGAPTGRNHQEHRLIRYAYQILVWKELSKQEQQVMLLKYTPSGSVTYNKTVPNHDLRPLAMPLHDEGGRCMAALKSGDRCGNQRSSGVAFCGIHSKHVKDPETFVTSEGEEFLSCSETEGHSLVVGSKPTYLSYEEIGVLVSLSKHQVLRLVKSANLKVESNPHYQALWR